MSGQGRAGRAGMAGFGEQDYAFAVGSVRGFRIWRMTSPPLHQNPHEASWVPTLLRGQASMEWRPGVQEALCKYVPSHKPPVEYDTNEKAECGCGYWAYWSMSELGSMVTADSSSLPIAGIIEGTGRVIIGEKGFRSQRAAILALAPAFSIQIQGGASGQSEETDRSDEDRELREAQENGDSWSGIIQVKLMEMYPDAQVFSTVDGMLATIKTGEMSE